MTKKINKVLKTDTSEIFQVFDYYSAYIEKTEIEKYELEQFVLEELLRGTPKKTIVKKLKEKEPNGKFSTNDVNRFMVRSKQFANWLRSDLKKTASRQERARQRIEEELVDLMVICRGLIAKYDYKGEDRSTIQAIKVLNTTLMNLAKIAGVEEAKDQIQVNIAENVANRKGELAHKILEADFKIIETEPEEVKNDKKNTEISKKKRKV